MPASRDSQRPNFREEAKLYYRNKENIEAKWLDQYGNVSRDNDYQRNRACMSEVFNMLDVVMDICIEDFRRSHSITAIDMVGRTPVYTFALPDGDPAKDRPDKESVTFSMPTTFARRVRTLRSIGYPISNELLYDTRSLRNETTHGNQTIVLRHMDLSCEETMKALLSMADALICLGQLAPSLRTPPFDLLRVKEGDSLMGGIYPVGPFIGEGGMSRVYHTTQNRTKKALAVKELKPGTYAAETIRMECDTLSRIHHPAVPQIYDTFSENDTYYIVMDYIDGVPLDQFIHQSADPDGQLTDEVRTAILRGLCDVLSYLHSDDVGLVFADLSPGNILVTQDGRPHLIDFGISGRKEERQVIPAATPGYSAPEVFSERILDERTDIYSFGQILRLLYTGLSPLDEADRSAFDLIPDPVIAEVVEQCTARSPLERYNSIEEVRRILFPDEVNRSSDPVPAGKHRRFLAVCGVCAALGIAVLAGYVGVLRNRNAVLEENAASVSENALLTMEEAGVSDHVIDWKDENLESGIRSALSLGEDEIMLSDLWETTALNLSDYGIQNIDNLSELLNLQYLALDGNEITDLTPLQSLAHLQNLSVSRNRIGEISPIAVLAQLHSLNLSSNLISDASTLRSLTGLRELWLDNNPLDITAFDWLSTLYGLQSLHLCDLGLEDCSFIQGCPGLNDLALSGNRITDLSPIQNLTKLESLYLAHNRLSSLGEISRLTSLVQLELEGNPVVDLSPLEGMDKLTWLDAPNCGIRDLTPLKSMPLLASLALNDNPIEDISPLSGLTRLSYLDLSNTGIEGGVDELAGLTALKALYLMDNQINDISALSGLKSLQYLELRGNPIEDYSPVDSLRLLEKDF